MHLCNEVKFNAAILEISVRFAIDLLAFLRFELLGAVVKQLLIHLHKEFQSVVDQTMDCPAGTQTFLWLTHLVHNN